jgi:uncharacterized protein involved in exopolysaccharide biosynthesis
MALRYALRSDTELRMNTPVKFLPEGRPDLQVERSDFRADYEDVVARALKSIARHKKFIALLVGAALALAIIVIPLMPRKYSAEALVYPNLFSREQGKVVALASVDAAAIVSSEARLIRSDPVLRAVVQRLELDRDDAKSDRWASQMLNWVAAKSDGWASQRLDWVRASEMADWVRAMLLPETRNYSPFDRAVAMLRDKVRVMNDTRSYLISISFTASSPEEAARIVNAIAIEYLRDKSVHRQLDAANAAQGELARQLAIYGQKHPRVLHAEERLEAARAALKAAMSPEEGGRDAIVADESVKLATPNRTPTSPKGLVILGLSFMLALLAGIGLAVWRDRRDFKYKNIEAPP